MGRASYWNHRCVWITGASGFLGSWLVRELSDRGAHVIASSRDAGRIAAALERMQVSRSRVEIAPIDLTEMGSLSSMMDGKSIDTVFHLAGQTSVAGAMRDPATNWEINLRGTWNVLEACRRAERSMVVVQASSDKAYGRARRLPYLETDPLVGENPYDCAKSCADLIATSYARSYGLRVGITRCGNFYGGADMDFRRLVPGTIRSVLFGERPRLRSHGRFTRDYLYIEDAVEAYLNLAESLAEDESLAGEAFNFSAQSPMSVLEMVRRVGRHMGAPDVEPEILDTAHHEIADQWLNATKARERLGWTARVDMDEGIDRSVAWYKAWFSARPEAFQDAA